LALSEGLLHVVVFRLTAGLKRQQLKSSSKRC
jgi:hypothetical protein